MNQTDDLVLDMERNISFVVLERTLESPLDCKEIQLSILKEISPEHFLEVVMLKLKLNTLAT